MQKKSGSIRRRLLGAFQPQNKAEKVRAEEVFGPPACLTTADEKVDGGGGMLEPIKAGVKDDGGMMLNNFPFPVAHDKSIPDLPAQVS